MPGSDDQYDQVHTYSQDHAGKSKTTRPAVRQLGRDGAPTRLFVGARRATPRTPPSGVVYLFIDDADGNLKQIDDTGTVTNLAKTGAPTDASYLTTSASSDLTNETELGTTILALDDTGVAANIDPASSTTPIQDAINAIGPESRGTVLLPPTNVVDTGPLTGGFGKRILGHGLGTTGILIDNDSGHGIKQDPNVNNGRDWAQSYLDGFTLNPQDPSARTGGNAINFNETPARGFNMGRVRVQSWDGPDPIIHFDTSHAFEFSWTWLRATGSGTALSFSDAGPAMGIGQFISELDDGSEAIRMDQAGDLFIRQVSCLASTGEVLFNSSSGTRTRIDMVHWECNTAGLGHLIRQVNGVDQRLQIGGVNTLGPGGFDYVYALNSNNQNAWLGPLTGGTEPNNNTLEIEKVPAGPSWFAGSTDDVDNTAGSTAESIWCLTDQALADPAHSGSATLSGGASPAARVNGVVGTEQTTPRIQVLAPNATGPSADYGYSHRFEWDDSAGAWDLVVEWDTDPGSGNDVSVDIEVVTKGIGR